ncbi:GAP family protein [Oerskovia sp. M15]
MLAGYCVVMVLPALVLTAGRVLAARQVEPVLARLNGWMTRNAASTTAWVVGIVGFLVARTRSCGWGGWADPFAETATGLAPWADGTAWSRSAADRWPAPTRGASMTHEHQHEHEHQEHHFDQAFWDERYGSALSVWSGNPNPHLVTEAADLAPGRALDVGSGEGADAVWLAQQGWRVVGLDISPVALERAADNAAAVGAEVADRIEWRQADLLEWQPGDERFDLVTAQFMHLPGDLQERAFSRLAEAVAPGEPARRRSPPLGPRDGPQRVRGALLLHGDDVVAGLDPHEWDVVTNSAPAREITGPEGQPVTIHDTVVRARRR